MGKPKILIVEDEQEIIDSIMYTLRKEAYEIFFSTDPVEAFSLYEREHPQVTLLDIKMPGMDGFEFLDRMNLKGDDPLSVIVISGHGDDLDFERLFAKGVTAFLSKPYNVYKLKGLVKNSITLQQTLAMQRKSEENLRLYQTELELQNEELRGAQADLQEALQKYTGLYELAPVGYVSIGPKGLIIKANLAITEMLGVERRRLLTLGILHVVMPEFESILWKNLTRSKKTGEKQSCEVKFIKNDRTWFWAYVEIVAVGNEEVTNPHWRMTVTDITASKGVEQDLRAEKDFTESLLSMAPAIILLLDCEGRIVRFNPCFEKISGYRLDEVQGKDWFKTFLPPEDHRRIRALFHKAVNNIQTKGNVNTLLCKDGGKRQIEWYDKAFQDESGNTVGLMSVGQDVTEQEAMVTALKHEKERAEQYLQLAGTIFVGLDIKGKVIIANQKAAEVLGVSAAELIGSDWFDTFIPEAEREATLSAFKQLAGGGDIAAVEFFENSVVTRQGEKRTIDWHNAVIKDMKGTIIGILGSGEDVTAKKRHEQQLLQAQKMEAIGTLASGIAHDFNNILSGIAACADLTDIRRKKGLEPGSETEDTLKACQRGKELTDQLLTFSRQEDAGREPVAVTPLFNEAIKFLSSTLPATIEIRGDLAENAGPVWGSGIQLYRMLINLCVNASHAMEDAGGILEIRLAENEMDQKEALRAGLVSGRGVKLSVSDTGKGIDPAVLPKIFDPFFTTKEHGKGTGIGLSVVNGIVASCGGRIDVKSTPGEGTTFEVWLPRHEEAVTLTPEKNDTEFEDRSGRILFVEDEPILGKTVVAGLALYGHKVDWFQDPRKALTAFLESPGRFDVVVTDMSMPGMTGQELAQKILARTPGQPIIVCTGYSEMLTEENVSDHGISTLLMKPYTFTQLHEAISRLSLSSI